jgi:hypothetical protein
MEAGLLTVMRRANTTTPAYRVTVPVGVVQGELMIRVISMDRAGGVWKRDALPRQPDI